MCGMALQSATDTRLERFGCPAVSLSEPFEDAARGRGAGPLGRSEQASRRAIGVRRVPGLAEGQDRRLARGRSRTMATVRTKIEAGAQRGVDTGLEKASDGAD